MIQTDKK